MILASASITLARVNDGAKGDTGKSVSSITEEYYLSTSKTALSGGSWSTTPPTWSSGKYVWTRSKIVYANPASTAYTTAICDSSWEAVNELQIGGRNLIINTDFNGTAYKYTHDNKSGEGGLWIYFNSGGDTRLSQYLKPTESYTISLMIRGNANIGVFMIGNPDGNSRITWSRADELSETDYQKKTLTFTPHKELKAIYISTDYRTTAYTEWYEILPNTLKLESGNKATDWTPAPEDVQTQIDSSIKTVDVEYYLSTSQTALSGGSWQTTAPTWANGKYMWSRTKTTLQDGTVSYKPSTNGTCIAGAKGETGTPGAAGKDGKTSYLHIKYSNDGTTFTENNGETLGAYIGTLVDFTETDSTTFSDYTWKKFTDDVDDELDDIRNIITQHSTDILSNSEAIALSALKSYVETDNFEQFKKEMEAEFKVTADSMSASFSATEDSIQNINGDLQRVLTNLEKHFDFNLENGLIIKGGKDQMSLRLDNGIIKFEKNGVPFGDWDGINFRTGNIYVAVDEVAQFGNYGFVPYEDDEVDGLDLVRIGG